MNCTYHIYFQIRKQPLRTQRTASGNRIKYYTKTVDSVFCSLWLATQNRDIKCYSLIHLQFHRVSERCQTCVRFKQSSFPVCCHNRQRNFTNNQTGCSRNTGRWQNSVWKLSFVCLTWICWWNQWKNVLFINANKSFLYLADMFTNKLKTKLNSFYWVVSNTKKLTTCFEEISLREQSAVCQSQFKIIMFDCLPITSLSSANQQYVQLIFFVISMVLYPNWAFSISLIVFLNMFFLSGTSDLNKFTDPGNRSLRSMTYFRFWYLSQTTN